VLTVAIFVLTRVSATKGSNQG